MNIMFDEESGTASILFPMPAPHGTIVKIDTKGLGLGEVIDRVVAQLPSKTQREAIAAGWMHKGERRTVRDLFRVAPLCT